MRFLDTKGNEHSVDIRPSRWPIKSEATCKSKRQFMIGQILGNLFPNDPILEEFHIPGERLYVDFFLPRRMVAVEVQGEQHDAYIPHFHGSKWNYWKSQERDARKKRWCETNSIRLIEVGPRDKEDEITNKFVL